MNDLTPIRCVLMRGGTSRGPFFLASDLPLDIRARDRLLLSIMGSGHPLQIDGIGGGNPVTSKVAIVGPASVTDADVDYLFAQVRNDRALVDTTPNCGNMLAAVGPFAIEAGLVRPAPPCTQVRIHNVNTGERIEASVPVHDNRVCYLGDSAIDGVPGTAAPIRLTFLDAANSRYDTLFPTGHCLDIIDSIEVSCIQSAIPMVLMAAQSFGLHGQETADELNSNRELLQKIEAIRQTAGYKMGLGAVEDKVIPKPVLLSAGNNQATITARYFMPHQCHPGLATTGAVGIALACTQNGTLAARIADTRAGTGDIVIAHPAGQLTVTLQKRQGKTVISVLRTARRLFEGIVFAHPPLLQTGT